MELGRTHVVGVASQGRRCQCDMPSITAGRAETAERRPQPYITNAGLEQQQREQIARKVRMTARRWLGTHVGNCLYAVGVQQSHEFRGAAVAMTQGVKLQPVGVGHGRSCSVMPSYILPRPTVRRAHAQTRAVSCCKRCVYAHGRSSISIDSVTASTASGLLKI